MKYTESIKRECFSWIEENGLGEHGGASIKQFCSAIGIERATFYEWLKKEDFSSLVAEAKSKYRENLPNELVRSLKSAAMGCEYEQVTTTTEEDLDGNTHTRTTKKNVRAAPNVTAAIFLLTNLEPGEWKNRQSTELKADPEAFAFPVLSDEQMKEAIVINERLREEQNKKINNHE